MKLISLKMNWLYLAASISRQAHSKWKTKPSAKTDCTDANAVLLLAKKIRKEYLPGSGVRKIYQFIRSHDTYNLQLKGWSKHRFEQLCLNNGLRVISKKYIPKTTIHGRFSFENKIEGVSIADVNKIWVSDICYIFGAFGNLIGYATSLIDLYSRYLLGLIFSETMKANETVFPALKQAYQIRTADSYEGAFLHSDGGKQYIYKKFINLLRSKNIQSSMARNCYENPFAEAFNDTLKNHLMHDMQLGNFTELKRKQSFIKYAYNYNKTHTGIGNLTPVEYETKIKKIPIDKRVQLVIKQID